MRAVWITKHGTPKVLSVRETPDPALKPGHLRISVKAAGLNFSELSARQGIYPPAPKPPCVVGYEGAGFVNAVGEGGDDAWLDKRVMFVSRFGAHADVACVPSSQVVHVPNEMSFEQAAALPVNYLTAYHMLFRVRRLQPGDKVLVHAAAGGVGTALLQLCRLVDDVETFGTAAKEKHDYVRAQGCQHPIDHTDEGYSRSVRQLAPRGLDLVCDALGAADWRRGYSLLAPAGMLIAFGLANAQKGDKRDLVHVARQLLKVPRFSPLKLMSDNRVVAGVDLGSLWDHPYLLQDGLSQLVELFGAGKIVPHIDRVFPFEAAAAAHRYLESRQSVGKILLVP